jgi:hypothetical protein
MGSARLHQSALCFMDAVDMQIEYPKKEISFREIMDASLTNYCLQQNSDNRSPSISIPSDKRMSDVMVGQWARDEHLPRFSDGEAPGEESEAEEARRHRGGRSQRS